MNYYDLGTGIYDKEANLKTRTEFIECLLFDIDGNPYGATVYFDVNDFVIEVTKIECKEASYIGVDINNQQDDVTDALRVNGYKSQEIKF